MKKALIFGISGQDGAYLAQLLLKKGYQVFGTSRDAQISTFNNLSFLGIQDKVITLSMALNDFRSVLQTINDVNPDEIYNLAGQSSVGLSFEQPVETIESISGGTLNILEAVRFLKRSVKFYNAGSSECFGNTSRDGAQESTPFQPRSPYAVAKSAAFWSVANYREAYNIYACSGILFNHESPLRPKRFVTQKIVKNACLIAKGQGSMLSLGPIEIYRDWGWAEEYVEAMWLMLQNDYPSDYVIATGKSYSLKEFIETVFNILGINWCECVQFDNRYLRPTDIVYSCGNPKKAETELNWKPKCDMKKVALKMVEAEMQKP